VRARRSILSVPGTERRFHAKAAESAADMVLLDMEDSVAPARKQEARGLVLEALRGQSYEGKLRAVRINGLDTSWWQDDLRQVVAELGERLDVVVVPKVESAGAVEAIAGALDELGCPAGLDLQIESARGMEAVSEIASASRRVQALHFGPGDFGADLRMPGLSIGAAVEDYAVFPTVEPGSRTTRATSGTTSWRGSWSRRGPTACRRWTVPTPIFATWLGCAGRRAGAPCSATTASGR